MRCRLIVLWILLALLPLRGWASVSMQVEMATDALVTASDAPHHASAPCHEAAPASADDNTSGNGHASCSLCDLCHGVALVSPAAPLDAVQAAVTRVRPGTVTDTGRALVGGLERPPRFPLA